MTLMKPMHTITRILLLVCAMSLALPAAVYAKSPYTGYIYNTQKYDKPSLNGYLYADSFDGYDMTSGSFKSPEDLFVTSDDMLYVVDSGNNRVVHMDPDTDAVLTIYGDKEGKGALNGPKGVFVTKDNSVYVADTGNKRIVVYKPDGTFDREYGLPKSELIGSDFNYSPAKLVVDKRGYMFVSSEGSSLGLMQIRPDGSFAGFYGVNHVPFSMTRVFVKLIASKAQRDQLALARPPEFSNLYQDNEGFIYTTSLGIRFNQVKRLSAVGVDTLNLSNNRYGDYFMKSINGEPEHDTIVDVSVSKAGFITALDQTNGELFQYDKLGNLLFIFGGRGNQNGLFKTATSVAETSDGAIYVADRERSRIDRFYPTPFAEKVHEASTLYVDGKYKEAMKPWQEVLQLDSTYDLAYTAIGKAYYRQHEYKEAMKYFKLGLNRSGYSDAMFEYRKIYIKAHFGTIMTIVIIFFILLQVLLHYLRKRKIARKRNEFLGIVKGGGVSGSH
jgi:DNA-binding beta-propeller fold protein YncE